MPWCIDSEFVPTPAAAAAAAAAAKNELGCIGGHDAYDDGWDRGGQYADVAAISS